LRKYTIFIILFLPCFGQAQSAFEGKEQLFTQPLSYIIYETPDSIFIDGEANETSWRNSPWSSNFTDIEGSLKPKPSLQTRFKMLWDKNNLYVYAELEEPHLWATKTIHDEIVYHDNDFEIFIDPDGDTHQYYEIEVNALNTIFDLYLKKPYRNGGNANIAWNANNLLTGIAKRGTLNNPHDLDSMWTVEMAIPFSALTLEKSTPTPQHNTVWRINFSRVQWGLDIIDDQYLRKKDTAGKLLPENNYVWSEQGVINMHFPERWGYAIFFTQPVGSTTDKFTVPFSEYAKQYVWLVYYKQKDFFAQHKHYAETINLLGFSSNQVKVKNQSCRIDLHSTEKEFTTTIKCAPSHERWQLTHEGLLTRIK